MVTSEPAGPSPQLVGATATPLDVAAEGATTLVPLDPVAARALAGSLARPPEPPPGTAFLRLEGIVGDHPANLTVFLDGADSQRAGVIGLFGLAQASRPDRFGEGGQGMAFSLEISAPLAALWRTSALGPAGLHLRLVPTRPLPAGARLRIGRISLLHFSPPAGA